MLEMLIGSIKLFVCKLRYKNHKYIRYISKSTGEPTEMICMFCGTKSKRKKDIWWDGFSN